MYGLVFGFVARFSHWEITSSSSENTQGSQEGEFHDYKEKTSSCVVTVQSCGGLCSSCETLKRSGKCL